MGLCAGWSSWPPGPPIAALRPRQRPLTWFRSPAHRNPRWQGRRRIGCRRCRSSISRSASRLLRSMASFPQGYVNEMRAALDPRALAAGQDALEGMLNSVARFYVTDAIETVRKARAGDPLTDVMLSQDLWKIVDACMTLAAFGPAQRIEEGAKKIIVRAANAGRRRARAPAIEARLKWIEDTCRDNDRSIDDPGIVGWLVDMKGAPATTKELGRLTQQMKRDRRNLRKLKKSRDIIPLCPQVPLDLGCASFTTDSQERGITRRFRDAPAGPDSGQCKVKIADAPRDGEGPGRHSPSHRRPVG